jgi:hypothetical protein
VWNGGPDFPIVDYGMGIAFGIYIVGNILIPAWWFTLGSRRYKTKAFVLRNKLLLHIPGTLRTRYRPTTVEISLCHSLTSGQNVKSPGFASKPWILVPKSD